MLNRAGFAIALTLVFVLACTGQQKSGNTVRIEREIEGLKQQLRTSPNASSLHQQLSTLLAAKGDWETSDREMATAIQLNPNNATLYIEAARGYQLRGLAAKALETLDQAVAVDPQNPLSHFALAVMYEHESHSTKAKAEFREAQHLINTLSEPSQKPELRSRVVRGTDHETYYVDRFGKAYLLDDILGPLKKRVSQ